MDFISGDLDRVFTVLYEMGRVEPILKRDWKVLYKQTQEQWSDVSVAIKKLNELQSLIEIRNYIAGLPAEVVDALVVEVARELANYQQRSEAIH
ncbi:MAG: hypothetical protein SGI74_05485 [Oligoflexia bacterium]|nr:hypothetical protein [Oligoflexia bacterium]